MPRPTPQNILQSITGNIQHPNSNTDTRSKRDRYCQLIKICFKIFSEFPSPFSSASGAQTVQRAPVSAALLAVHLNMTVASTRERFSSPATAQRPAVRPLTAPSALRLENACGLANSSAQVCALVLRRNFRFRTFMFSQSVPLNRIKKALSGL